ncbi:hypothetical protein H839_15432 [Parageobacillus genomosp. 1]|uniref:Uncharacterized protein n=1 Tax=Parageobacillus genomosp. 1 TaxID=1295642 RepID=A0ABC9VBF9_9BACL|nr:hypothetical protein [Parageobacillus genomosp. 1]EZP75505.1 hypothetical protein H839_15432 [Parageobacillus genomosp. 1]
MGKWISVFLMMIIISILLFFLVGALLEDAQLTDIVTIVISIQCSLIITLLIAILEKLPKKK